MTLASPSTGRLMSHFPGWAPLLAVLALQAACATTSHEREQPAPRQGSSGRYAQSMDSATNACLRNPACYTQTGEEAILPWLERSLHVLRTAAATLRLLEAAEVQQVEQVLVQCTKDAHLSVNDELGYNPTEAQCREVEFLPLGPSLFWARPGAAL